MRVGHRLVQNCSPMLMPCVRAFPDCAQLVNNTVTPLPWLAGSGSGIIMCHQNTHSKRLPPVSTPGMPHAGM